LIVKMREIVPTYSPWQAIPNVRSNEPAMVGSGEKTGDG
jgi:hypothetical protein